MDDVALEGGRRTSIRFTTGFTDLTGEDERGRREGPAFSLIELEDFGFEGRLAYVTNFAGLTGDDERERRDGPAVELDDFGFDEVEVVKSGRFLKEVDMDRSNQSFKSADRLRLLSLRPAFSPALTKSAATLTSPFAATRALSKVS